MVDHRIARDPAVAPRRPLRAVAIVAAAFVVISLITGLQLFAARRASHEPGTLAAALLFGAATWSIWAVAAPGIAFLGERFDFAPGRRLQSTVVHLAAALACIIPSTWIITMAGFALYSSPADPLPRAIVIWRSMLTSARSQLSLVIYVAILALARAVAIWRQLKEREVQASRLEAHATRARLEALGTRLQPHFLFNTLHTIGALIDEDPPLARGVLVQLGDLLRDVLAGPSEVEAPLHEELALLRRYLDIEQIRFADRLQVEMVTAPDALDLLVPRLLLQPLVENALRHGLAPRSEGGMLRLHASVMDGRLRLRVWNNGIPLTETRRDGIGLTTTRERLHTRHGSDAMLVLRAADDGGVESLIEMPASVTPR
jgi:two-component system LytT family sensor kinase